MTSLSHPEAISSSCASLYSHLEEDGIYWEHTYGNTFRESVSMKSIMSQVASDVAACLRLAKKKKKERERKKKEDKSTLSVLISVVREGGKKKEKPLMTDGYQNREPQEIQILHVLPPAPTSSTAIMAPQLPKSPNPCWLRAPSLRWDRV